MGLWKPGDVYGHKLDAWVTEGGKIVQYALRPANLHDLTVGFELNGRWPEFGGPRITGDRSYAALGFVFPPQKNTRYDTGWRISRHPKLRKRIETVFSQPVAGQMRSVQAKTLTGLRLRVVSAVLAHNITRPKTASPIRTSTLGRAG